ncbi:MAG: DUF2069 domain-containing protein [Gammaproteobacteria bacterium]|nr:DUF2069 domain-containing protein [Gammaproteobacteria bacterium]
MLSKSALLTHKVVLVSYISLIILSMFEISWLNPPEKFPISLLLILYVGPLLIPLKSILAGKRKTHLYLSFISLFYFAHGSVKTYEQLEIWTSLLQLLLSLTLFISCLVFTKQMTQKN